jgi:signal transduction histidine kinase
MGLSDFIVLNVEAILSEFVAFACTQLPAASGMDTHALRDHGAQVLAAIAKDMKTPQSRREQQDKSQGLSMPDEGEGNAAAEIHGALRATAGFDVNQAAAEYRALRASVLRLWFDSKPELGRTEVFELVRFNESMDEALAASLLHFASEAAHMRNLFLGVLSHELRTPLSTIVASGQLLQMQLKSNPPLLGASERALRGARRIESLLDSLLDYVRSGLGEGMRISLERVDLGALCARIVAEVSALYPDREVRLETSGDVDCDCDEQRIGQAVSNLLTNAYKYGDRGRPIEVAVATIEQDLSVQVKNFGPAIPPETLESFFQPLVRGASVDKQGVNLGLGLYIVREIASAHGGSATVVSNDELGTTFTLRLPRHAHADSTAAFRGLKMN